MKVKLNLSSDGIKQFLFNNGEKIVLAVTALVLLLFLLASITAKPVEDSKSPDKLREVSRQVHSRIGEPGIPPADDFPQTSFSVVPKPVDPNTVAWKHELSPPLFKELTLRADPELFPPEQPEVSAGNGIVAYNPNPIQPGAGVPIASAPIGGPPIGRSREHDEVPDSRFARGLPGGRPQAAQPAQTAAPTVIAGVRQKGAARSQILGYDHGARAL